LLAKTFRVHTGLEEELKSCVCMMELIQTAKQFYTMIEMFMYHPSYKLNLELYIPSELRDL
jgi:hypothetical protein